MCSSCCTFPVPSSRLKVENFGPLEYAYGSEYSHLENYMLEIKWQFPTHCALRRDQLDSEAISYQTVYSAFPCGRVKLTIVNSQILQAHVQARLDIGRVVKGVVAAKE